MADLVGTCPKDFWERWIAEGDVVGEPESGELWYWYTSDPKALEARPSDRLYIVAHGKLRGYAPVVKVKDYEDGSFAIIRKGGAVACTIDEPISDFEGLRKRWWKREQEIKFPNWRAR